jgi:large subunit ribosomal protein L25
MANRISLKAEPRLGIGRLKSRQIRGTGKTPAVLYGVGAPQALQLSSKELVGALNATKAESVLVDLEIVGEKGAKKHLALLSEVQIHPLKDKVLHVDLHEIDPNKKVQAEVSVHEVGEPAGVRTGGGILDHLMRHVRVECLPQDLPSEIKVDVSNMEIGDAIHVKEIQAPAGVTFVNSGDLPVFMVHAPKTEEVVAPAAGAAAAATPEVITAKKTDAAAAPAAAGKAAPAKKA